MLILDHLELGMVEAHPHRGIRHARYVAQSFVHRSHPSQEHDGCHSSVEWCLLFELQALERAIGHVAVSAGTYAHSEDASPPVLESGSPSVHMTVMVVPGTNVGVGAAQVAVEECLREPGGTVVHVNVGSVPFSRHRDLYRRDLSSLTVIDGVSLVIDRVVRATFELLAFCQDLFGVRLHYGIHAELPVASFSLDLTLDRLHVVDEIECRV